MQLTVVREGAPVSTPHKNMFILCKERKIRALADRRRRLCGIGHARLVKGERACRHAAISGHFIHIFGSMAFDSAVFP